MKFIDTNHQISNSDKRKYMSILRSQISTNETSALFINCFDGVVDDGFESRDGFAGVDIGKISLSTADGNQLAKRIQSDAVRLGCLPGKLVLEMEPIFSLKGTKLVCVNYSLPSAPAKA